MQAGRAELRQSMLAPPQPGESRVRALVSGISRGTESLVFQGRVPPSEWARMRAPFQEGAFPFPVKYGYAMVGEVDGGKRVFCLYPHQSLFNAPAQALIEVPAAVSTERAALAPQMETALNALWDGEPKAGDKVAVVGGGVIGLLTAYLCARTPGVSVTLIDANPQRAEVAAALKIPFAAPGDALPPDRDLVFHASGSAQGLDLSLSLGRFEATILELSWFGEAATPVHLGGAFHSQRLTLKASQVGSISPSRRGEWDHRRRLTHALALCADPALDVLVSRQTPLAEMPARFGAILAEPSTLCHLIRYPEA